MRSYKLIVVLKSDLGKEKKAKLLETVGTWAGAKDAKTIELGEKKLSYAIRHERKGDYVALEFGSDKIDQGFERRLAVQEDILRHLMLRMK